LKNEAYRRNKQTACFGIRVINLGQALLPKENWAGKNMLVSIQSLRPLDTGWH